MINKRHTILDDAWEMNENQMGGAAHTVRVGLVTNTVMNAMPVVLGDLHKLVVEEPKFDSKLTEKDLPILLHAHSDNLAVAILVVHDKETDHIQCYPFNNLADGKHWWLYEMAFDIVPGGFLEVRPVHPMVEEFEPTQGMMDHLEALATIVSSFLCRLQDGSISISEGTEDFSKINIKRRKNKREPIINDWNVDYV